MYRRGSSSANEEERVGSREYVGNKGGLEGWINEEPGDWDSGWGLVSMSPHPESSSSPVVPMKTKKKNYWGENAGVDILCEKLAATRRDLCQNSVGDCAPPWDNQPPSHGANPRDRTDEKGVLVGEGSWELQTNMREKIRLTHIGLHGWLHQRHRWLS